LMSYIKGTIWINPGNKLRVLAIIHVVT